MATPDVVAGHATSEDWSPSLPAFSEFANEGRAEQQVSRSLVVVSCALLLVTDAIFNSHHVAAICVLSSTAPLVILIVEFILNEPPLTSGA